MDSRFDEMMTNLYKMNVLMEEQNSRNIRVIDSHNQVNSRQDKLEDDIKEEKTFVGMN